MINPAIVKHILHKYSNYHVYLGCIAVKILVMIHLVKLVFLGIIYTKNKEISGTFLADKNYIRNRFSVSPPADISYTVFQYRIWAAYVLYLDILRCREHWGSFCCSFQMEEIAQKFPRFWSDC